MTQLAVPHATPTRRIAVGVLALALGIIMVTGALGVAAVVGNQPRIALNLPTANARPLAMFALQQAQSHARPGDVAYAATRASALSPLVEPAFTGAGLVAGTPAQATLLLDHAHQLSRRNPFLLAVLFERAHANKDYTAQVNVFDQMARLQIDTPAIDQTQAEDLLDPAARERMAMAMAGAPFWRGRFLGAVADNLRARPALVALVNDMRQSPMPLSRDELQPLVGGLLYGTHADPVLAYHLWHGPGSTPRFDWPNAPSSSPQPFEWSLSDSAALTSAGPDRHLVFDTRDAGPGTIATRSVLLEPGRYRAALVTDTTGMIISLTCKDQTQRVPPGGTLTVGADCGLVRVQLQAPAGTGTAQSFALQPLAGH